MILTSRLAQAVAVGRKTTHRAPPRLWRPEQRLAILKEDRERGDGPLCHVEIVNVAHDQLRDLTRAEAKAEGFDGVRGPLAFKRYWLEQRDKAWVATLEETDEGLTDEAVAGRFADRHVGDPIAVLTWRLVEAPLFLASQRDVLTGRTDLRDYTTNRARAVDELEVIEPDALRVKRARAEGERQRAAFRRDLEAERARRKGQKRPHPDAERRAA